MYKVVKVIDDEGFELYVVTNGDNVAGDFYTRWDAEDYAFDLNMEAV